MEIEDFETKKEPKLTPAKPPESQEDQEQKPKTEYEKTLDETTKIIKIFRLVIFPTFLIAAAALGIWYYRSLQKKPTPLPSKSPLEKLKIDDVSLWEVYKDEALGYEIKYPKKILANKKDGSRLIFTHFVFHKHPDPCDMRDGAAELEKIVDFDTSFEIVNKNLKEALLTTEGDYINEYILSESELKILPNFIDKMTIGSLSGYQVYTGVEGCGRYNYYFPLETKKILVVSRSFVPELQPITKNYLDYFELPGIILPSEEERLFREMLSSFKYKTQEKQTSVPEVINYEKVEGWQEYVSSTGYSIQRPVTGVEITNKNEKYKKDSGCSISFGKISGGVLTAEALPYGGISKWKLDNLQDGYSYLYKEVKIQEKEALIIETAPQLGLGASVGVIIPASGQALMITWSNKNKSDPDFVKLLGTIKIEDSLNLSRCGGNIEILESL